MAHSPIVQPGEVPVFVKYSQSPAAHPSAVAFPSADGMTLVVAGGMSKFELATIQIAAALTDAALTPEQLATRAADLANAVLVECQRRQTAMAPVLEPRRTTMSIELEGPRAVTLTNVVLKPAFDKEQTAAPDASHQLQVRRRLSYSR